MSKYNYHIKELTLGSGAKKYVVEKRTKAFLSLWSEWRVKTFHMSFNDAMEEYEMLVRQEAAKYANKVIKERIVKP